MGEFRMAGQKVHEGLHRAWTMVGFNRVAIEIGILHDEVAAGRYEGSVGLELGPDVIPGMV